MLKELLTADVSIRRSLSALAPTISEQEFSVAATPEPPRRGPGTPVQFLNLHGIVGTDSVDVVTESRVIGYLETAVTAVSLSILADEAIAKTELF